MYLTDLLEMHLIEKISTKKLDCLHKAAPPTVSISVVTFQITMSFLEDLLEWFSLLYLSRSAWERGKWCTKYAAD